MEYIATANTQLHSLPVWILTLETILLFMNNILSLQFFWNLTNHYCALVFYEIPWPIQYNYAIMRTICLNLDERWNSYINSITMALDPQFLMKYFVSKADDVFDNFSVLDSLSAITANMNTVA